MHKGWKEENSMGIADPSFTHWGSEIAPTLFSLHWVLRLLIPRWNEGLLLQDFYSKEMYNLSLQFITEFYTFHDQKLSSVRLFYVGICSICTSIWLPTSATDFVSHTPECRTFLSTAAHGRGISWNCSVFSTFMIILCHHRLIVKIHVPGFIGWFF